MNAVGVKQAFYFQTCYIKLLQNHFFINSDFPSSEYRHCSILASFVWGFICLFLQTVTNNASPRLMPYVVILEIVSLNVSAKLHSSLNSLINSHRILRECQYYTRCSFVIYFDILIYILILGLICDVIYAENKSCRGKEMT